MRSGPAVLGLDLKTPRKEKKLEILYLRPLDLSVDEPCRDSRGGAEDWRQTLVIDSLAGFEMALAPGFRGLSRIALPG